MRHFHDKLIGKHAFFTFTCEGGYVGTHPDRALQKDSILGVLAACLEVDYVDAAAQITSGADPYDAVRLSPNEARVINEFMDFYRSVTIAFSGKPLTKITWSDGSVTELVETDSFQGTWLYTNLNEGKSVAWSVFLEE